MQRGGGRIVDRDRIVRGLGSRQRGEVGLIAPCAQITARGGDGLGEEDAGDCVARQDTGELAALIDEVLQSISQGIEVEGLGRRLQIRVAIDPLDRGRGEGDRLGRDGEGRLQAWAQAVVGGLGAGERALGRQAIGADAGVGPKGDRRPLAGDAHAVADHVVRQDPDQVRAQRGTRAIDNREVAEREGLGRDVQRRQGAGVDHIVRGQSRGGGQAREGDVVTPDAGVGAVAVGAGQHRLADQDVTAKEIGDGEAVGEAQGRVGAIGQADRSAEAHRARIDRQPAGLVAGGGDGIVRGSGAGEGLDLQIVGPSVQAGAQGRASRPALKRRADHAADAVAVDHIGQRIAGREEVSVGRGTAGDDIGERPP